MIMSDVGWTLWAAIQARISAIDYDFTGWAEERWARASSALDGPEFEVWLREVQSVVRRASGCPRDPPAHRRPPWRRPANRRRRPRAPFRPEGREEDPWATKSHDRAGHCGHPGLARPSGYGRGHPGRPDEHELPGRGGRHAHFVRFPVPPRSCWPSIAPTSCTTPGPPPRPASRLASSTPCRPGTSSSSNG